MAKQYYELYEEIKNLKPRTQKYYKAVSKMFKLEIDKEALMKIRAERKTEGYKKGKTFSQAVRDYEQGIKYENESIKRAYSIWSGEYFENRVSQYVNNYLKALEKNNISKDIIDYLRANPDIIMTGGVPYITAFYVPSRGKGKRYSLNIENNEQLDETLREHLEESWGMPKRERKK